MQFPECPAEGDTDSAVSAYSQGDSGFKFEVKGQILRGVWHSLSLLSERCVPADHRLSVYLQK